MNLIYFGLPTCLVALAVFIAIAPWGAPVGFELVVQIMPYMVAHLFIARGKGAVPSLVMFIAGVTMDVATGGPLGFWAFVYLFGLLIVRQLPPSMIETYLGRLSGLLLIIFALTAVQVGVASLYQLKWVDWYAVLAGTAIAGGITGLIDVAWRERRLDRDINVTARVGGRGTAGRASHV